MKAKAREKHEQDVRRKYDQLRHVMDERVVRRWAAAEADAIAGYVRLLASALALSSLTGCYASHSREPTSAPDAAVVECAELLDECEPMTNQACVRFHDRTVERLDIATFIATRALDVQLATPGAMTVAGCEMSFVQDVRIDMVRTAFTRARVPGTSPITRLSECTDAAGCVWAGVAESRPFDTSGGDEVYGGTFTLSAIDEREGGHVCGSFSMSDRDGLEILTGVFDAALRICDR